jgi:hypothetical protein
MGSSSREDEAARALERGGSGSCSRKKMAKAVSWKYAFRSSDTCSIGGASVLGWQASWAVHCGCAAWAANESGEVGQPSRRGRGGTV